MNGFEDELKKRILGIVPHVVVSSPQSSFNDWQTIQQQLLSLPLVSHVTPIIESEALVLSDKGLQGVIMQGIIPELEQHNLVNSHLTSGNLTVLNDRAYAVVIGQSLARKLDVRIGEKINLVLPNKTRFTPMGRVPMQRSFTIADVFNVGSPVDNSAVYVHSHYAAKMMREKEGSVSALRIYLTDAFSVGLFIKQLPIAFAAFDILPWSESQGALFAAVGMEKNMMWLMLSLIIAVAAFNIISALVMVVINKQGEIAILQTFGMNRANVFKIFITQGMINGLWGVFLGIIIGVLLTFNLNELLSVMGISILGTGMSDNSLPIDFQLRDIMTIIFSSLSMSLLATLYPAYRASLTQPAEVLRHE
jgi:lipoprotein-releasing system permease protein